MNIDVRQLFNHFERRYDAKIIPVLLKPQNKFW